MTYYVHVFESSSPNKTIFIEAVDTVEAAKAALLQSTDVFKIEILLDDVTERTFEGNSLRQLKQQLNVHNA